MKFPIGVKLWAVCALIVLSLFVFFQGLGDVPFYTRGESREGLVVWEMYKTGNVILPLINGDYIPFKPPLFHWIGVLVSTITGDVNELTIRFPSALFAALGIGLVYLAGRRFWGETSGLFAALVLASNSEWWHSGTLAQVDMSLAFFMTATLLLFYFIYCGERRGKLYSMGLGFLLACATLAKGPVGLVIPLLIIGAFLWLKHDFAFSKELHLLSGAAVFLIVAGGWYAAALWQGGSAFWVRQIIEENFGTAGGNYGHHQPYSYYLPIFFVNFLPWSYFILPMLWFLYQRRRDLMQGHLLFPLVWLAIVLLFFSVASGKRGIYILPLYPAFALLCGAWWANLDQAASSAVRLTSVIGYLVAAAVFLVALTMAFFVNAAHDPRLFSFGNGAALREVLSFLVHPSAAVWLCLALFGAASLLLFVSLPRHRWKGVFIGLLTMSISETLFLKTAYYPALAQAESLKPFAVRLRRLDPGAQLWFYQAFDYGTIFYSRRHIASYSAQANDSKKPTFLLMWEENFRRMGDANGVQMLDISEGRGPADKHRLVLAEAFGKTAIPDPKAPPGPSRDERVSGDD